MEKIAMEQTAVFTLPRNKKVKVVPIIRPKGYMDKDHEAVFLFGDSTVQYCAPKDKQGRLICPLTEDEREFFEDRNRSGMSFEKGDLSPFGKHLKFAGQNAKPKNFWETKSAKVTLDKFGRIFDLSNPADYIDYKILLSNKDEIAPSGDDMYRKATYKFALTELEYESKTSLSKAERQFEAHVHIEKLSRDKAKMIDTLLAFGKKVSETSDAGWLKLELIKIASEDADKFNKVVGDKYFEMKLVITRAISKGLIKKRDNRFYTLDGTPMALAGQENNIIGACNFLSSNENQDILIRIESDLAE